MVVAILAILAGLVIPLVGGTTDYAQSKGVDASLAAVRDALVGKPGQPGYFQDVGSLKGSGELFGPGPDRTLLLRDLYVNPAGIAPFDPRTARGWRGPYLTAATGSYRVDTSIGFTPAYGAEGDPAPVDPWNHPDGNPRPIVIQWPSDAALDAAGVPSWSADAARRRRVMTRFVRLVSAGPSGTLTVSPDALYPDAASRGDNIVLFVNRTDTAVQTGELQ
jgi:type II secretory pathway pseudopilin PulG